MTDEISRMDRINWEELQMEGQLMLLLAYVGLVLLFIISPLMIILYVGIEISIRMGIITSCISTGFMLIVYSMIMLRYIFNPKKNDRR